MEVPFWAESPSPFTFIFWVVLWLWGLLHLSPELYKDVKRIKGIYRLVNGLMVVGLVVFQFDSLWILFEGIKYAHLYPAEINVLLIRLIQNVGLFAICLMFTWHLFRSKTLDFSSRSLALLVMELGFFIVWFGEAPDMTWTDWTLAIRLGTNNVLPAFFISHIIGKLFQGLLFISLWRIRK